MLLSILSSTGWKKFGKVCSASPPENLGVTDTPTRRQQSYRDLNQGQWYIRGASDHGPLWLWDNIYLYNL